LIGSNTTEEKDKITIIKLRMRKIMGNVHYASLAKMK